MSQQGKQIFERLGSEGLLRVLDDLLDHRRLVRLANACGLRYPGMRTQSQKRERLLSDLVERGRQNEAIRPAITRALDKETRLAFRRWNQLSAEQRAERMADDQLLESNGNLGLHLYILAKSGHADDAAGLETLLSGPHLRRHGTESRPSAPTKPSKEEARLRKKLAELQKKSQHLDSQLAKSREAERTFKRDLIQRKGELAESRMLAERLRRELDEARQATRRLGAGGAGEAVAADALEKLSKGLRKMAAEQKKLTQKLDKALTHGPAATRTAQAIRVEPESLAPLQQGIDALRKELATRKRERKKETERVSTLLEEIRDAVRRRDERQSPADSTGGKRRRSKTEPERVGVFIDVQNMYYGARRLKGKLDFDALQQAAVRERRLIQATAYVVESKEIDQSGFIALLEQRAIEVRRKTLQVRADGSMKGDWDMELALDVLDAAPRLDVVVLVSGDGDFTSLVKRVKKMGPRVEVIGFPRTTAKSLLEAADQFQPLDRKFMIYPRRSKVRKSKPAAAKTAHTKASAPKATDSKTAESKAADTKEATAKAQAG